MISRQLQRSPGVVRLRSERGATATEYGLLVGFIAFVIVTGVGVFGTALDGVFNRFGTFVNAGF